MSMQPVIHEREQEPLEHPSQLSDLKAALLAGTVTQVDVLNLLATVGERFPDHEQRARDQLIADDDTEIDDTPLFSRADDGVWVSAWLWVRDEETNEEEPHVR